VNDAFNIYGPPELCTWRYAPGICRFQTTDPQLARKLSQRRGTKLVLWSVAGDYLRVFQEKIALWRARQLVMRFQMPTNGTFSSAKPRLNRVKDDIRVGGAADKQTRSCGFIDNDLPTTRDLPVIRKKRGLGHNLLAA
jgi:hypothetical protein